MADAHTQERIIRENKRTDIEALPFLLGNPLLLNRNEFLESLMRYLDRHLRNIQNPCGVVQAVQMIHRTEDNCLLALTICLEPLENRLSIVQRRIRRAYGNLLIRHDARIMPALFFIIIHLEHIVREMRSKANFRYVRLFLQRCCFLKSNLSHSIHPPIQTSMRNLSATYSCGIFAHHSAFL